MVCLCECVNKGVSTLFSIIGHFNFIFMTLYGIVHMLLMFKAKLYIRVILFCFVQQRTTKKIEAFREE